VRIAGGTIRVSRSHPLEKIGLLSLKPIQRLALPKALSADVDGNVKIQRKVWLQLALDPFLENLQSCKADPSTPALVRKGCVREAVTENNVACCESGQNDSVQVLAAGSEHEQRLGLRGDRAVRIQQQFANGLP
jgi:hypothetical protein